MKRWLSFVLSVVLLLGLASCSSKVEVETMTEQRVYKEGTLLQVCVQENDELGRNICSYTYNAGGGKN